MATRQQSPQQSMTFADSSFIILARAHAKRQKWRLLRVEFAKDLFEQPIEVAVFLDTRDREVRRTVDQICWAAERLDWG